MDMEIVINIILLICILINIRIYSILKRKIALYDRLNNSDLTPPKPIECKKCKATYHRDDAVRKKKYSYDDDYSYECPHCKALN